MGSDGRPRGRARRGVRGATPPAVRYSNTQHQPDQFIGRGEPDLQQPEGAEEERSPLGPVSIHRFGWSLGTARRGERRSGRTPTTNTSHAATATRGQPLQRRCPSVRTPQQQDRHHPHPTRSGPATEPHSTPDSKADAEQYEPAGHDPQPGLAAVGGGGWGLWISVGDGGCGQSEQGGCTRRGLHISPSWSFDWLCDGDTLVVIPPSRCHTRDSRPILLGSHTRS